MERKVKSMSIDEVEALLRKDPEYQKAERLVGIYNELAAKIIRLRSRFNMTQKELAEKAETYQSRISKIESGDHDITLSTLTKIAEAFKSRVVIEFVQILEEDIGDGYKYLFPTASLAPEMGTQFLEDGSNVSIIVSETTAETSTNKL